MPLGLVRVCTVCLTSGPYRLFAGMFGLDV